MYGGIWFGSETYKPGEKFHLKTTFDGTKKYFHDYVQQGYKQKGFESCVHYFCLTHSTIKHLQAIDYFKNLFLIVFTKVTLKTINYIKIPNMRLNA